MASYKYGVSFQCLIVDKREAIGNGDEEDTSIDFVGDDLDKIAKFIIERMAPLVVRVEKDHALTGESTNVGGVVVAVVMLDEDDKTSYPVAVIFEDPVAPTVIE